MISELRGEGGSLALLTFLALIVGAISGAGVACFMLLLEQADQLRDALLALAHAQGPEGVWLIVAACAVAAGIAASLVRRISPQAAGSGIPQVEAILSGQMPEAPFRIIPVKFIGGALAIGAGLALGREGPSVHMAGCCSLQGRERASPRRSTRQSPAPSSCSRNWCGDSNCGSRSRRLAPRRAPSRSPERF